MFEKHNVNLLYHSLTPSFAPSLVDKTENVQERKEDYSLAMRIPPPLTRTWWERQRTEKLREGQREGLHPLITDRPNNVTVTSSPLETLLPISLFSQPNLHRGRWPEIMMWLEVSICQGDKTDSSKTTFSMMDQWEECQFTMSPNTNCALSHLWSRPFIPLSNPVASCCEDTS